MKPKRILFPVLIAFLLGTCSERSTPSQEKRKEGLMTSFFNNSYSKNSIPYSLLSSILKFKNHTEVENLPSNLNQEKKAQLRENLEQYLTKNKIISIQDAIAYSLDFVAKSLTFRTDYFLGEKGSSYYKFPTDVKSTDCRDYAFLFSKTFEYVCERTSLKGVNSQVIRSLEARIFGFKIDDHDWVKITDETTGEAWCIDPTFYDIGFPHNLDGVVQKNEEEN